MRLTRFFQILIEVCVAMWLLDTFCEPWIRRKEPMMRQSI